MDLFERVNRAFGAWYEGLFGGSDDVRPKDVLRRILVAMEENRKEGFDSRVYVPNKYILEVAVDDEEEKEYLLSFLDRDELEAAVRRYCEQNHYEIRGGLDFTIQEVEPPKTGPRQEKVRVRCRYDSKAVARAPLPEAARAGAAPASEGPAEDNPTVYEVARGGTDDEGTVPAVASARLVVEAPGHPSREYRIARGAVAIGRSAHAGNDIVLGDDGMVSRRHARVEMDADGRFTLYDLDTTNGTRVNGRRVDNRTLNDGDEILLGATRIVFHQEGPEGVGPSSRLGGPGAAADGPVARLVLADGGSDIDDFVLATETQIGRGLTNSIVLSDRSVATRHARLVRGTPYHLEALDPAAVTLLNGAQVRPGVPVPVQSGDRITLGSLSLRFEEGQP